ncbi:hypothetical protein [Ralstonia solanacearum]|uniref:hypothetical protein n=1 Tax=Ralstonia solanacearum TaxID=305 RepID=UPI0001D9832E|nr:hypothetical protein [Ralstonia solanacearum]CBJ52057.1 protein of unknown function [Ralstonia solanacearum PSI07]
MPTETGTFQTRNAIDDSPDFTVAREPRGWASHQRCLAGRIAAVATAAPWVPRIDPYDLQEPVRARAYC